jgi:hypothetical protein
MLRTLILNKPEWLRREWTFFFQFLCMMSVKYICVYRLQYSCNVRGGSRSITYSKIYLNNIFSGHLWAVKRDWVGHWAMHACMYVRRYVCMLSYIRACMYVCMFVIQHNNSPLKQHKS